MHDQKKIPRGTATSKHRVEECNCGTCLIMRTRQGPPDKGTTREGRDKHYMPNNICEERRNGSQIECWEYKVGNAHCHQRERKTEEKSLDYIVGVVRKNGWCSPVMYEGQISGDYL